MGAQMVLVMDIGAQSQQAFIGQVVATHPHSHSHSHTQAFTTAPHPCSSP